MEIYPVHYIKWLRLITWCANLKKPQFARKSAEIVSIHKISTPWICETTLLYAVLCKYLFKVTIRTLVHYFSVFIVDFLSIFRRWLLLQKSSIFDNWQVMLTLPIKAFFQSYNKITKTASLTSFSCMYC